MTDKNCLSYWFPKLLAAGLPVPRTEIIRTDCRLFELLDGKTPEGFDEFIAELTAAADSMGYPCFLRTGQGSNKHDWENSCFIPSAEVITSHVVNLVEWSSIVDFIGLPTHVWAVRELLPTVPMFRAFLEGCRLCRSAGCLFGTG